MTLAWLQILPESQSIDKILRCHWQYHLANYIVPTEAIVVEHL